MFGGSTPVTQVGDSVWTSDLMAIDLADGKTQRLPNPDPKRIIVSERNRFLEPLWGGTHVLYGYEKEIWLLDVTPAKEEASP